MFYTVHRLKYVYTHTAGNKGIPATIYILRGWYISKVQTGLFDSGVKNGCIFCSNKTTHGRYLIWGIKVNKIPLSVVYRVLWTIGSWNHQIIHSSVELFNSAKRLKLFVVDWIECNNRFHLTRWRCDGAFLSSEIQLKSNWIRFILTRLRQYWRKCCAVAVHSIRFLPLPVCCKTNSNSIHIEIGTSS